LFQIPNCRDQCVDVFAGVVESERGTDRGFNAKAAKDRLRTMMARADGDTLAVESRSHIFGTKAVEHEGKYAGLFARRADQPKPGDALQSFCGIEQKIVFVARDVHHANALEIVDRRAETNGIRDVAGAGWYVVFSNVTS
jgi:hypothetical protein